MKILTILALLALAPPLAIAQWEMNLDMEVYNPTLSPDGSKLLYFTDDDVVEAHCVDASTGKKAWSRKLEDFEEWRLGRFIGNDTVLVGQLDRYEFLNARDGSVYATIPIAGESWSDVKWEMKADPEYDTLAPYFKGDIGVFFFYEGMQVIDLHNAQLIYQTSEVPSKVKFKLWESVLLINPDSGADTLYFLDFQKKKIVYKGSKDDNDLNSSVYQPFAISNGELLLFNEENIQSVDLSSGATNGFIKIDPDDPEFYTPVIFKNSLYLMVSDEGIQSLYKTKDATLLWKTPAKAIPGVAEQLVELPNEEGLLYAYDDDGRMMIYKINTTTGKIHWSRHMFTFDGDFESGHKQGNQLLATVGKFALQVAAAYLQGRQSEGRFGRNPQTGMMEPRENFDAGYAFRESTAKREREQSIREANEMYNSWINTKKSCDGYTALLELREKEAVLVCGGKIYSPDSKGKAKTYNGEGVFTLNLEDGSISAKQECVMVANSDAPGEFNAVTELNFQKLEAAGASALIGWNDIYIVRPNGIERHPYGQESITFINSSKTAVTVSANHDDDYHDYWRIDATVTPARKQFIARSYAPNVQIPDTSAILTTLHIQEREISAFQPVYGDVSESSFSNPKWQISRAELDKLDIGDLGDKVQPGPALSGAMFSGGDVFFLGDDAIAYISSDGSCRWRHEWDPEPLKTRLGATIVSNSLLFATGDVAAAISVPCPKKVIGELEISFDDTAILHGKDRAVIVDTDEGIIRGFNLP